MYVWKLYLWEQQYILRLSLNYRIEKTDDAFIWYQFKSTASKKNVCPQTEFWKILTENTTILEQ